MRRPRYFLNTILGVVIAAGCSTEQPGLTDPRAQAEVASLEKATILSCTPLPADSASAVIGKDGGSITVGPHTLVIPARALSQDEVITAVMRSEAENAIRFGPQGLLFKKPAYLTMSFANCGAWGQVRRLQIAFADDALKVKELVPSVRDNRTKTITGAIQHFSIYAVAF